MKREYKNSTLFGIIRFGLIIIASCFVMLIFFAIVGTSEGEIDPKYNKWIFIGGLILAVIINFITSYNTVQKLKSRIPKYRADIESTKKMRNSLIEKANKVVDKYTAHEADVMEHVADSRKVRYNVHKVNSAVEFRNVIENYPDLKSNNAVMRLLDQLENTEVTLLNFRTAYSNQVAEYNEKIHVFPFSIIRGIFKLEDIEIENDEDTMVTDEELGI